MQTKQKKDCWKQWPDMTKEEAMWMRDFLRDFLANNTEHEAEKNQ